jgi:hypothetical protein
MQEKLERNVPMSIPETEGQKENKENVVEKVVRTFFGGDRGKFKNRVETSLKSGQFMVGSGQFLRSIFEQNKLSTQEFNECQKAIRIEISNSKKREKQAKIADTQEAEKGPSKDMQGEIRSEDIEKMKEEDKIITDEIRARIRKGAVSKEQSDNDYTKEHKLDDPTS